MRLASIPPPKPAARTRTTPRAGGGSLAGARRLQDAATPSVKAALAARVTLRFTAAPSFALATRGRDAVMLWASSRGLARHAGGSPREQERRLGVENSKALALAVGLVGCATLATAQAERSGKVAEVFAERCAACHGAQLQGGQAKSLLDEWRYGGDDASLTATIRDGRTDAGMPPFAAMMGEQEVRALVIFIREKADAARRAATVFAKPQGDTVVKSDEHAFKVETVAEGLDTPWSIAFLPDGGMLVTEKPGRLSLVTPGKPPQQVLGVPAVWSVGQGGCWTWRCTPSTRRTAGSTCRTRTGVPTPPR